jgi:hypothetical protein
MFRTPEWAKLVANSKVRGSEVVVGKTTKGVWKVQSVLIRKRKGITKTKAVRIAKQIRLEIEGKI